MPVIRTFISHHGGDYEDRVAPILRQIAPLGVRPWLDKRDLIDKAGLPLDQMLQEAIFNGTCTSLTLFLTKSAATRRWIEFEVQMALERLPDGFRIIPILLDPLEEIDLPETFVPFLKRRKVIWLEPTKNPRFLQSYAASVHAAGSVDKDTTEITIYLGHRRLQWDADLPTEWAAGPVLHLRLALDGAQDFSPTEAEWQELERGLTTLRENLGRLERINICGQAPLGLAALIGKVWDRSAGATSAIQLRSYNVMGKQVWTTDPQDYDLSSKWAPEKSQHVKMARPVTRRHQSLLLALLPAGKMDEYLGSIHRWNEQRDQPALVHVAQLPDNIRDAEHAREVLRECVGVMRYIRRACPSVDVIEVVPGYPLALAPLFLYHLRTLGPVHLYDQVKLTRKYHLVTTLG